LASSSLVEEGAVTVPLVAVAERALVVVVVEPNFAERGVNANDEDTAVKEIKAIADNFIMMSDEMDNDAMNPKK
jgi:hypothetical protein